MALASQRVVELLARAAPDVRFESPLSGLTLGGRLRWYDERLRGRRRLLTARRRRSHDSMFTLYQVDLVEGILRWRM